MDIREALEKASETIETAPEPVVETAPVEAAPVAEVEAPASEPAPPATRARDDSGRFAPKPKDAPEGTPATAAKPAAEPAKPAPVAAGEKPLEQAQRAPQSWKPAIREKFATLPPDVQEEVVRRERETARVLQENAQLRQTAGAYQETLRPYEQTIRARGQEPAAFVRELLQTEHALATAPAGHKADLLAHLIVSYGVQPDALDRALAGRLSGQVQAAPQLAQQQAPQQFRDPRLDQLLAERHQRAEADATTKAGEFAAKHEFYEDVAPQMAAMLEAMAKNGQRNISTDELERVYTAACLTHPDVAPVFEQRRAAEAAAKARASTQRTRAAASSVRASPAAASAAQPKGIRGALEAAAEALSTR